MKPTANETVPCPLPKIMTSSSKRVQDLVENMQRFGAKEQVEFEEMKKDGHLHSAKKAMFDYSAYIHEYAPQHLVVDEFRNGNVLPGDFPSKLLPSGTAALALILHPNYLEAFSASCEGQADWKDRKAWVVRLQQVRDNDFRGYRVKNHYHAISLKARAWIDSETFDVLHLETNLLEPKPDIALQTEPTIVDYGMVSFPTQRVEMWLPQAADIYMDYRGKKYHFRYSFSDFQLFSVGTSEKVSKPKE